MAQRHICHKYYERNLSICDLFILFDPTTTIKNLIPIFITYIKSQLTRNSFSVFFQSKYMSRVDLGLLRLVLYWLLISLVNLHSVTRDVVFAWLTCLAVCSWCRVVGFMFFLPFRFVMWWIIPSLLVWKLLYIFPHH